MPHTSSSKHSRSSAVGFGPLSDEAASFIRRFAAILLGVWLGAILMVTVTAPAAFQSVDISLKFRTPPMTMAVKMLGEPEVYELLRYQVGEANRQMFEAFGLIQLVLAAVIFFLLLFFSHVRRLGLGLSLLMLLMSTGIHWLLIPTIVETGRLLHTSQSSQAQAAVQRFRALHTAFSTFEATVSMLAVLLLILLLRRRRGGRSGNRSRAGGGESLEV